mmetsp:Transcript_12263/g.19735  ORF Transcript_12263/g.19735 Transcript_12263/m.19735 type:complete len:271 (+) Transcript_12263:1659-2471(+)
MSAASADLDFGGGLCLPPPGDLKDLCFSYFPTEGRLSGRFTSCAGALATLRAPFFFAWPPTLFNMSPSAPGAWSIERDALSDRREDNDPGLWDLLFIAPGLSGGFFKKRLESRCSGPGLCDLPDLSLFIGPRLADLFLTGPGLSVCLFIGPGLADLFLIGPRLSDRFFIGPGLAHRSLSVLLLLTSLEFLLPTGLKTPPPFKSSKPICPCESFPCSMLEACDGLCLCGMRLDVSCALESLCSLEPSGSLVRSARFEIDATLLGRPWPLLL